MACIILRGRIPMILIEHAVVVSMDPERRIFGDGSVLIDGERIVQVGRAVDVRPPRPPDRVIDGRGTLVLPGFIDTHAHLSEHLSRGLMPDEIPVDRYVPDWYVPLYASITPEEEAAAAQLACLEMLRTGTTTFCEAGTLFDVPAVARAVDAVGLRAVLGRWTWDLASGPGPLKQSTDEALQLTGTVLAEVNGKLSPRVSAWPLLIGFGTCSERLIRGAHALAERHGTGWGMMQFASHPSRKTADTLPLATLDAWGVLGPRTKLAHMVHVGSNHFDMLRLMYLAALVPKDARLDPGVMPPERVLEMATIHGARALGLEREIGSLEPGKRADLIVFDLDLPEWRPLLDPVNTLVYSASAASVRTVMVDGRVVLAERRVTTVDEGEVLARAERLSRPYLARAGLAARLKWPML